MGFVFWVLMLKTAFLKTEPPPKIAFTRSAAKDGTLYIKSENSEKRKLN
jgi:hypothetical protein